MTWCMRLNVEKCKVMRFVKSNHQALYCIGDDSGNEGYIEEPKIESNLDVVISNDLKWREQNGREGQYDAWYA